MAITLSVREKIVGLTVGNWVDKYGQPAKVQGDPRWESTPPGLTFVDGPEGLEALPPDDLPVDENGNPVAAIAFELRATVDADLSDGVKEVSATEIVTVTAEQAVGGQIGFGRVALK